MARVRCTPTNPITKRVGGQAGVENIKMITIKLFAVTMVVEQRLEKLVLADSISHPRNGIASAKK